jgi:hypothetical protein
MSTLRPPAGVLPNTIIQQITPIHDKIHLILSSNTKRHWRLLELINQLITQIPHDKPSKWRPLELSTLRPKPHQYIQWHEQITLNLPVLYLASQALYIYAKQHQINRFLFATRDCCHWIRIFQKLFPEYAKDCRYFNCSRNMLGIGFREKHEDYLNYVSEQISPDGLDHTVYVDIHGTGQHLMNYFTKNFCGVPFCFLLSSGKQTYEDFPHPAENYRDRIQNIVFGVNGGPIESLNYDTVGTLQNYSKECGAIRDDLEYSLDLVAPYHECIQTALDLIKPLSSNSKKKLLLTGAEHKLHCIIKDIFNELNIFPSVIRQQIHHVGRHPKITSNDQKSKTKKNKFRK